MVKTVLFCIACIFVVLFIFCHDGTSCGIERKRVSRERSLLVTKNNPSSFNKWLDTMV